MTRASTVVFILCLAACSHEGSDLSGTGKPAAAPAGASAQPAPNPHAGMDMSKSPHAADPHAGVPMTNTSSKSAPPAALPIAWTVPEGWKEGAATGMRVAQFAAGADESGSVVQCVVFGGIGGDDEQNLQRWVGQMGPEAKGAAKTTHVDHDGLKITRLEARGPYTDSMAPGGAKIVPQATMLAAIVESPAGKLHVKFTGASSFMDAQAAKFDAFLASMKPR